MKRVLVVALVVVLVLIGIPLMVGSSTMACPDCEPGMVLGAACLSAVLAGAVGVALPRHAGRLRHRPHLLAGRLATSGPYRPPRRA